MNNSQQICMVFDLDDTLYKERDFVISGRNAVACAYSQKAGLSVDELNTLMNNSDNAFDALLALPSLSSVTIEDILGVYRCHKPLLKLPDDSKWLINELHRMGIMTGIITDGRSLTQWNKIEALGLDRMIDRNSIIVSEDIGVDKTTSLPFEAMMNRCPTHSYLYVGDNPVKDFYYPRKLGWTTVMLRDVSGENTHPQDLSRFDPDYVPDTVIDNIKELKNIILPCL